MVFPSRQALWLVVAVLAAGLLAGMGFLAGRWLSAADPSSQAIKLSPVAADCMPVGQRCEAASGATRLVFYMGPGGVTPLEPFTVEVDTGGLGQPAHAVQVEFRMEGMDMGLNRYRLRPQPEAASVWRARGTLPVCSARRLDWIAVVEVEAGDALYQARFPFTASAAPR